MGEPRQSATESNKRCKDPMFCSREHAEGAFAHRCRLPARGRTATPMTRQPSPGLRERRLAPRSHLGGGCDDVPGAAGTSRTQPSTAGAGSVARSPLARQQSRHDLIAPNLAVRWHGLVQERLEDLSDALFHPFAGVRGPADPRRQPWRVPQSRILRGDPISARRAWPYRSRMPGYSTSSSDSVLPGHTLIASRARASWESVSGSGRNTTTIPDVSSWSKASGSTSTHWPAPMQRSSLTTMRVVTRSPSSRRHRNWGRSP